MNALLSIEHLGKAFGAVKATHDVSFEVDAGGIAGVIGPNGAGKTTMFNIISGFTRPDEGRVVFDGRDITGMSPHRIAARGLVRTFQTTRPLHSSTVRENVIVGTHLRTRGGAFAALLTSSTSRRTERQSAAYADALLAMTGLDDVADAFPGELSGGRLRLLEIARALASRPRMVLLDEPAAGLNQEETHDLEVTLRRVRDDGATLLIVEHDVELIFRMCDRVTVLDFGEVLRDGKPEDIRRDPAVADAYFGPSRPLTVTKEAHHD